MKQILFVDDKPAIGKVLSVYLGKAKELVFRRSRQGHRMAE